MHAIGFGARFAMGGGAAPGTLFDFSLGVLPPGARLARGSAATCHDANGTIVAVAADVARFDRDPVTGARRGLLIEPAATNLIARSTDWTDPYWTSATLSVKPGALIETAASGTHVVRQAIGDISYTAGQSVSVSAIVGERSGSAKRYLLITLGTAPTFGGVTYALFDIASGTAVTAGSCIAGIYPAGGGARLCVLTATPVAAAAVPGIYTGDGTSGLNVTHLQIEAGAVASTRIVTGAGAATRAADVLTLDWRSRGVADGPIGVRYGFDDGSTQDATLIVAGGVATVPVTLARRWITRVQKL